MHISSYIGECVHNALGSDSHSLKACDPPIASLPESEGAGVKSKKGGRVRNPRGGVLFIGRIYV